MSARGGQHGGAGFDRVAHQRRPRDLLEPRVLLHVVGAALEVAQPLRLVGGEQPREDLLRPTTTTTTNIESPTTASSLYACMELASLEMLITCDCGPIFFGYGTCLPYKASGRVSGAVRVRHVLAPEARRVPCDDRLVQRHRVGPLKRRVAEEHCGCASRSAELCLSASTWRLQASRQRGEAQRSRGRDRLTHCTP